MQRETRDDGEGRQVRGPDGLQRLWTPHRMAYIKGENKPHGSGPDDGCPFCRAPQLSDPEGLVLARGKTAFALLNLYPYNSVHLMVCPYRHVADYTELNEDETAEIAALTRPASPRCAPPTEPKASTSA